MLRAMKRHPKLLLILSIVLFCFLAGFIWMQKSMPVPSDQPDPLPTRGTPQNGVQTVSTIPEAYKSTDFYETGSLHGQEAIHSKGVIVSVENGGALLEIALDYQQLTIHGTVDSETSFSEADFTVLPDGTIDSLSTMPLGYAQLASLMPGELVRITFYASQIEDAEVPLKELILLER